MKKIKNIEWSVIDGLVCVQVMYANGDYCTVSIPEERFGKGLCTLAATDAELEQLE